MDDREKVHELLGRNWVGPVLQSGEFADSVVEALGGDNPGADIRVFPTGSWVRVLAASPLILRRASLREALGRDVRFPGEVEVNLSAFAGQIRTSSDEIEWYFGSPSSSK